MRFREITIHNFKSLRNVQIAPAPFCVLVGANASGKTNFASAMQFIGQCYRDSFEVAVGSQGGFVNIAYRHVRPSKAPISFHLVAEAPAETLLHRRPHGKLGKLLQGRTCIYEHAFAFRATSQAIQAHFSIVSESMAIRLDPGLRSDDAMLLASWTREKAHPSKLRVDSSGLKALAENASDGTGPTSTRSIFPYLMIADAEGEALSSFPETVLLPENLSWGTGLDRFVQAIGSARVFMINPGACREPGSPTPNPELAGSGQNLPVMVEHFKKAWPEAYGRILDTMRCVMPSLQDFEVDYTHRKTLALFLKEKGFGRAWPVEDASDGTLHTLALLLAVFDPRTSLVVLEEPENSIHPWALRHFVEAARLVSEDKQIILTTHSPVLIDQLRPEEVWVAQRPKAETLITPLVELDPSMADGWDNGEYTLAEYLDSGAVPEAVPAG